MELAYFKSPFSGVGERGGEREVGEGGGERGGEREVGMKVGKVR